MSLFHRFIAQIHSVRGQDRLLIGNNTSKVDKKLEIPPATARRPRPLDPLRADQRGRASDLVRGGSSWSVFAGLRDATLASLFPSPPLH